MNLRGVVHGIQAVYPVMIGRHSAHIVITASVAGLLTSVGQASYAATKHAVVAISKTLRLEAEVTEAITGPRARASGAPQTMG